MVFGCIHCYTSDDIKALQQIPTDKVELVDIVSLESVRVARESYAVLRELLVPRKWICDDMLLFSLVAGVSLELHKIKHDLLPRFLVQEAKLDGDVLEALLVLKNSAIALLDLAKGMKEEIDDVDEDLICPQVRVLGISLKHAANQVQISGDNIDSLQERLRPVVGPIDALLATPVVFRSE
ncbi:unnamed protein product [Urochloa humidicola]